MLHLAPVLLVALVLPQDDRAATRPVDMTRSAILEQVRATIGALLASRSAGPDPARGFSAVYQGSVMIEGHYRTPGQRSRSPCRIAIDCRGPGVMAVRETSGTGARASTETTLFEDGRVARQGSERARFEEIGGTAGAAALASAARWFPALALEAALGSRASC